jgi:hypothetical protein
VRYLSDLCSSTHASISLCLSAHHGSGERPMNPAGLLYRFRRPTTAKSDRDFPGLLSQRRFPTQDVVVVLGEAVGFIANVLE